MKRLMTVYLMSSMLVMLGQTSAFAQIYTINHIYTNSNLPLEMTDAKRADLELLRISGINTISISGYSAAEISNKLVVARRDAALSKFNYILDFAGPLHDTWTYKLPDVCSPGGSYLTDENKALIRDIVELARKNADKVVGYYTFDEPVLTQRKSGKGICKEYQTLVRKYLRSLDDDAVNRPVFLANTSWNLTDTDFAKSMSNDAQDVMFWEEYDLNQAVLTDGFQKLKRNNFTKPLMHTFPAYNISSCTAEDLKGAGQNALEGAITSVYGNSPLATRGISYFSYWPGKKPDFNYAADNCPSIMRSVTEHIRSLADLVATRIDIDPETPVVGQPVKMSVEVKNVGSRATGSQILGVVMLVDDVCPSTGCYWGILDQTLLPGQSRMVKINGNGNWLATAGNHKITAWVEESRNLIEANRDNNFLNKEVTVYAPPTMTLDVSPRQIKAGQTVTRVWTSQNTTSCYSKTGTPLATSGAWETAPIYASNTYQISCRGPGGSVTQSADVTVIP